MAVTTTTTAPSRALIDKLARALTFVEVEELCANPGAIRELSLWTRHVRTIERELETARDRLPGREAKLRACRDALASHEMDNAAKKADEWKWGQKRSELLEDVKKAEGAVSSQRGHIEYVEGEVARVRAEGPLPGQSEVA